MTSVLRLLLPALSGWAALAALTPPSVGAPEVKPASPVSAPTIPPTSAVRPAAPIAPAGVSYETFRTIGDRNIFDPNRTGRSRRGEYTRTPTGDMIAFVGTMEADKGYYAFFDGSDAQFRRALHEGESVADFKVMHIKSDSVELSRAGKTTTLQISQRLNRPVGEDWAVSNYEAPRTDTPTTATNADPSATDPSTPPPIPADASDTLKRLMEQRRNQLKQ